MEGLTKLKKLDLVSKKAEQAENLRKLLLAISDDVRVLLVKLADRLHNMRTLDHVPEAKRLRIAEETRAIYAPLAGRMGMQGMREELEELAFGTSIRRPTRPSRPASPTSTSATARYRVPSRRRWRPVREA